MASAGTVAITRALLAALQPLTGPAASGALLVRSSGATGSLPAGSVAVPVSGGGLEEAAAVFVTKNPATADGAWPLTSSGALVSVEALHGGPVGDRIAGTEYRWLPAVPGVEATSESDASTPVSGGSYAGALRRVVAYKSLERASLEELFRANVNDTPAAVLAWVSSAPMTGATASNPGPRAARAGRSGLLFRHSWILFLVTSNLSTEAERRREGDSLRDDVLALLHGKTTARGVLRISNNPGLELLEARVRAVTPTAYIDEIRFGTTYVHTPQSLATDANPWLTSHLKVETEEQAGAKLTIPDIIVPMVEPLPRGFDDGFDGGFS